MEPDYRCGLVENVLIEDDYIKIKRILQEGGLCVLPSDSSYTLTGRLSQEGVSEDINALLDRNGMNISLAFGGIDEINSKMKISNKAYRFIRYFSPSGNNPGGLTFVAKPTQISLQRMSTQRLFADGTIGVRLTQSQVETQMAKGEPIPTTPIRDVENREVIDADEAWKLISERVSRLNQPRKIAVIDGTVPYPGRLSSVVKEVKHNGCWCIQILRTGAISNEEIKKVALMYKYAEVFVSDFLVM